MTLQRLVCCRNKILNSAAIQKRDPHANSLQNKTVSQLIVIYLKPTLWENDEKERSNLLMLVIVDINYTGNIFSRPVTAA